MNRSEEVEVYFSPSSKHLWLSIYWFCSLHFYPSLPTYACCPSSSLPISNTHAPKPGNVIPRITYVLSPPIDNTLWVTHMVISLSKSSCYPLLGVYGFFSVRCLQSVFTSSPNFNYHYFFIGLFQQLTPLLLTYTSSSSTWHPKQVFRNSPPYLNDI